jgi:hypothetical protein
MEGSSKLHTESNKTFSYESEAIKATSSIKDDSFFRDFNSIKAAVSKLEE